MRVKNYSAEPESKLYSWLPPNLEAEEVVFFPDACPGKSPLPTGTAVVTASNDWRKYAVSDCGCGMQLLKSNLKWEDFQQKDWDELGQAIRKNKGGLGDLGGGNHFLDALVSYSNEELFFLIHTGSRMESGLVDQYVDSPGRFEEEFQRVVDWARENRNTIALSVREHFGNCEVVLDLDHNGFEKLEDGKVIIRKGAVQVNPGSRAIIPSSMSGDVALVKATDGVADALFSLSHGTGRIMSRSQAKQASAQFDFTGLRKAVYIPSYIDNSSLRTEGPYCYRPLNDCLALISTLAQEEDRFAVIAYLGHL